MKLVLPEEILFLKLKGSLAVLMGFLTNGKC